MALKQSEAARGCFARDGEIICTSCGASGRIISPNQRSKSRKGSNAGYRKSLQPGQEFMAERSKNHNERCPRKPTLAELDAGAKV
jgi:hypothetical protein